jgi:hypothetical protein
MAKPYSVDEVDLVDLVDEVNGICRRRTFLPKFVVHSVHIVHIVHD